MKGPADEASPGVRRSWQVLVAALLALAVLTPGVGEALPRALAAAGSMAGTAVAIGTDEAVALRAPASPAAERTSPAAERTSPAAERTSMEAPVADLVVRGAPLAVVPAPTGPVAGLLPGGGPLVAPHLVAQPQSRPPTARLAAAAPRAPVSRGPPTTTGA